MREAVVEAKVAVGETREAVARCERDLTQERQRLAQAQRRGRPPGESPDRGTGGGAPRVPAKQPDPGPGPRKKTAGRGGGAGPPGRERGGRPGGAGPAAA